MDVIWGPRLTQKVLGTRSSRIMADEYGYRSLDYATRLTERCMNELTNYLWEFLGVRIDKHHVVVRRVRREHLMADEIIVRWDPKETGRGPGAQAQFMHGGGKSEFRTVTVPDLSQPVLFARQVLLSSSEWWRGPESMSGPAHTVVDYELTGWNETQGCWVFKPSGGKNLTLREVEAMDGVKTLRSAP